MSAPPPLPAHVSANGLEIWAWAADLSAWRQRQDRMRELTRQIAKVRCGDCQHWMKSRICPREHNVNGRNKGPSCEGVICDKFVEEPHYATLRAERRAELNELIAQDESA
jgi:hypothetical protein